MSALSPPLRINHLPRLDAVSARRIFLSYHGLLASPGPSPTTTAEHLDALGFVQVDSVCTLMRAHDMILSARHKPFRPADFGRLLERDRTAFEHWTHDAAILPMSAYPFWRHKMARDADWFLARWIRTRRAGFEEQFEPILSQIAKNGPVTTRDVGEDEVKSSGGWWDWAPSKTALEFLWRRGDLAITARQGFRKVYDLAERVIPEATRNAQPDLEESLDWSATQALDRLGFATSGEIAAFHALMSPQEAKDWVADALAKGRIDTLEVPDGRGGWRAVYAFPDLLETLDASGPPATSSRLRILSPFDPALRDRKRAKRLFDFDYRIEIFVPEAKRTYGYYVFPILDGCQMVGRIDLRVDRASDSLLLQGLWLEPGVAFGAGRAARLGAEIQRYARLTGMKRIDIKPCEAAHFLHQVPL